MNASSFVRKTVIVPRIMGGLTHRALVLVALCLLPGLAVAQSGFLQIRAEPGVRVSMDGALVGVTEASIGGLIVQNVPTGERQLLFEKDGFRS